MNVHRKNTVKDERPIIPKIHLIEYSSNALLKIVASWERFFLTSFLKNKIIFLEILSPFNFVHNCNFK